MSDKIIQPINSTMDDVVKSIVRPKPEKPTPPAKPTSDNND